MEEPQTPPGRSAQHGECGGLPTQSQLRENEVYLAGEAAALEDRRPHPRSVWHRIPDGKRAKDLETVLVHWELSPRELAFRIRDRACEFLSESIVSRSQKAADLIESLAYVVLQPADRFHHLAWKLCATKPVEHVIETLDLARAARGVDRYGDAGRRTLSR